MVYSRHSQTPISYLASVIENLRRRCTSDPPVVWPWGFGRRRSVHTV